MKAKTCLGCGGKYQPEPYHPSFQRWCSVDCGVKVGRQRQDKARAKAKARVESTHRKETKRRREALKTKSDYAKEAQTAFNLFIRMRDWGKPCISCDRMHGRDHQRHASHYRSVKAAKQLRFNGWNVWTSCQQCNTSESGNILEYRKRLILKIGQERLDAIENNNELCTHDAEYYRRVKRIFNKRARHYKKLRGIE